MSIGGASSKQFASCALKVVVFRGLVRALRAASADRNASSRSNVLTHTWDDRMATQPAAHGSAYHGHGTRWPVPFSTACR